MAATRRLTELISSTLPRLDLPDGPVDVALSGGADSASLLLLALEANRKVGALHVDHGFPASGMLAEAAAGIAAEFDIPLRIVPVRVSSGPSVEDQARAARYAVFFDSDSLVLTGHTRDDSVETMLINLIRGTGAAGLTGIPRFRPPNVHRPMLGVTRSETREIATLRGLRFVDDPMNEDLSLVRNRIRLEVIPILRELNPRVESALARTASILERDTVYLDDESARQRSGKPGTVPVSVLTTLPRALGDRLLRGVLEESGLGATTDRIGRMWSVAAGDSVREDLAEGRSVIRRGALLIVE